MTQKTKSNALSVPKQSGLQDLQYMFMNAPIGIFSSTPEGKFLSANYKMARMLGYDTPAELLEAVTDISSQIYADPSDREKFKDIMEKQGRLVNHVYRLRRRNGEKFWVSVNAFGVKNQQGRIIAYQGFYLDISEQKEAEEYQRRILEATNDGIWDYDLISGEFRYSDRFARMLGYEQGEVGNLGCFCEDNIHPEDKKLFQKAFRDYVDGRASGYELEFRLRTKSGDYKWIYTRGKALQRDASGRALRLVGAHTDITERRKADAALLESVRKYSDLFENAPVGIFQTTPDGRYISINSEYARIFGYESPAEMVSLVTDIGAQLYLHPRDREKYREILHKHGYVNNFEARMKRRDGQAVWVSMNTRVNRGRDGEVIFDGFLTDISSRKIAEKRLQESEEKLRTLFSVMTEMVVLHELVFDGQRKPVDYLILDCNRAFTTVTGIKRDEAVGRRATEVYNESRPPFMEVYSKVAITGQPVEFATHYSPMDKYFHISVVSPKKNQFATIVTDISESKQAEDALREQEALKHILMNLATTFINVPLEKIDEALGEMLEKIGRFTEVDRVYIFQHNHDRKTTSNTHEWCAEKTDSEKDTLQDIPLGVFKEVFQSFKKEKSFHVPSVVDMQNQELRLLLERQHIKSLVMLPLTEKGVNTGFVGFDAVQESRPFTRTEIDILRLSAEIISNVLSRRRSEERLKQANSKLRRMAMTDELTGICNRRSFFLQGEKEIQRSKRFKSPLSLLMMDLDKFKDINDSFGHDFGDRILQQFALTIQNHLRQIDLFARLGGEEFGVLLPGTNAREAAILAQRLRKAVRNIGFEDQGKAAGVTVSTGIASSRGDNPSLDQLISRADSAMYLAKEQGRDRVVTAAA